MIQSANPQAGASFKMTQRITRWLSVITALGVFTVFELGVIVTNTGSQAGCGNDWPLCKGQLFPNLDLSSGTLNTTAHEFIHRIGVPIETVLILAMIVGILLTWRVRLNIPIITGQVTRQKLLRAPLSLLRALGQTYMRARIEIKVFLPAMIGAFFAEAIIGALDVAYPQSAPIKATHFGISLLSFVTILLPAIFVFDENGWDKLRDRGVAQGFRWLTWGLLAFTVVVIYLGAYMLHAGAEAGCLGWPLCNGQVFPGFGGLAGTSFIHRLAAGLLTLGIVALFTQAWRLRAARHDLFWASVAALILVLCQAVAGAIVIFSQFNLFSKVAHSFFVALLVGVLCYMSLHVVPRPRSAREGGPKVTKRILGERRTRVAARA